jgi:hypothetical protein
MSLLNLSSSDYTLILGGLLALSEYLGTTEKFKSNSIITLIVLVLKSLKK